jgi:hypothetical protein
MHESEDQEVYTQEGYPNQQRTYPGNYPGYGGYEYDQDQDHEDDGGIIRGTGGSFEPLDPSELYSQIRYTAQHF